MNLNLFGPINTLGYGYSSFNLLKSLLSLNINVAHFMIGPQQPSTQEDANVLQVGLKNAESFDQTAPCVKLWHQFDLATRVGKGTYYGFPIFELESFKPNEITHLQSCDHILVCSHWAKEVVDSSEVNIPCSAVPLGVDSSIFAPQQHQYANNNHKCIFFNCGKWEIRKGHDILKDLFVETFTHDEDVELWMMSDNPFLSREESKEWEEFYSDPRIKFIHKVNTHKELANIMNATTCGIFPSRAEGWNLEVLEMMACGKPVMVTDYSGHTEFCKEENSMGVKITELESAYDGKWFHGNGQWATLDEAVLQQFKGYLHDVYEKWKSDPNQLYNAEGVKTAQKYSWDNSARTLIDIVQGNE